MFDPKSPDDSKWDFKTGILCPDLPPPVPPRKKITSQVAIPDGLHRDAVLKSGCAGKIVAREVSRDLISLNSSKLESNNHSHFQPENVARSEQTQDSYKLRHEPFTSNLDSFFKDDLFKSTCDDVDLDRTNIQDTPIFCDFSSNNGTLESVSATSAWDTHSTVSKGMKVSPRIGPQKEGDDVLFSSANNTYSPQQHQKTFASRVRHCKDGIIELSSDSKAAGTFDSLNYDDFVLSEGDLTYDDFTMYKGDSLSPQSPKWQERAASKSDNNFQKDSSDDEEDDYILMGPAKHTEICSEYKAHINTFDKQQRHQKTNFESDAVEKQRMTCRRRLTSQRSLSDSAICKGVDVDDKQTRTCGEQERRERKQMKTSPGIENIKCKAKNMWSKFAKRIINESQQEAKEEEDLKMDLVCACRGSCERIGSMALSPEGHIWVAFLQCSWVSLYDSEQLPRKFDTRGIVDCLAVSPTGVLYISCPQKKRIMMLSENLELIIMHQDKKLHPRGLDVSPIDGAVVVCMTSQEGGQVMKRPSTNSLMKFSGKKANEKGQVLNKGNFLGYPMRLAININGYILVSDYGLECIFAVSQEGHMLKKFSTVGDGRFCQVHCLTSGQDESFHVVHGGRGKVCSTRLVDHQGTVVEKETSRQVDPDIYGKVRASAVKQNGLLAVSSGTLIKYLSLD